MTSDAVAYYEHNTFFIEQIVRGVYPLWEPGRDNGVPIELYLRRIGSYNPFILMPLLFRAVGVEKLQSYLLFIVIYYFLGMVGFYKLAKVIFNDRLTAFFSYLILMFSSLGTRLFDSYILFTIIPLIWFFYFLVDFGKQPQKHSFFGLIFTLMILFTTYVPFFFINIFITFLLMFCVFYFTSLKDILSRVFTFIKENKLVFILGVLALGISFTPGILLFQQMSRGEIVVPMRGNKSTDTNALSVAIETVTSWGMEEDLVYALSFRDLRKFKFAIIYLPFFSYLILFLGSMTFINRKKIFFLLWTFGLLLMFSHYLPMYTFLNKHVFYFKYFRNLHFFLWMIILPVFVLFLGSLFQSLVNMKMKSLKIKILWIGFVLIVHGIFFYYFMEKYSITSTRLTVIFSFLLFLGLILMRNEEKKENILKTGIILVSLFLVICVQPGEVYYYLSQNYSSPGKVKYRYDHGVYTFIRLPSKESKEKRINNRFLGKNNSLNSFVSVRENPEMYMGVKWGYLLFQNLNRFTLDNYMSNQLMAYDQVELLDENPLDLEILGKKFAQLENKAFVSNPEAVENIMSNLSARDIQPFVEIIEEGSPFLKITDFDVNDLRATTNFPNEKFLVYNTNFHHDWQAYIDGKKVRIYRSNFAFIGFMVPGGEHQVHLLFAPKWKHFLNWFLLVLFQGMLWGVLIFWFRAYSAKMEMKT